MTLNTPTIPMIVSCNWLDNENDDLCFRFSNLYKTNY